MATKILMLEDVDNVGHKGEIAQVKSGYAYNYLLPNKLAILATPDAIRRQVKLQEERRQRAILDRQEAEKLAAKLDGVALNCSVKVDHEGHMYGSVSVQDIVHLVKEHTGLTIEKKCVQLKAPIRSTGMHEVQLRLKEGVQATVHITVMPEENT